MNQRGIIHLLLLLLVVAAVAVLAFAVYKGYIKIPSSVPFLQSKPSIQPKTQYKNPFDKKTQYVNPFEEYKNPFTINK